MSKSTFQFVRPVKQYLRPWDPADTLRVKDDTAGNLWRPPTDQEIRSIQAMDTDLEDCGAGIRILMLPNHLAELLWNVDPAGWRELAQDRKATTSRTLADDAYTSAMSRISDFLAHIDGGLAEPEFLAVVATQPPEPLGPLDVSQLLGAQLPEKEGGFRRYAWVNLDDKIQHIFVARSKHDPRLKDAGATASFFIRLVPGDGAIWNPDFLHVGQWFESAETAFVSLGLAKRL